MLCVSYSGVTMTIWALITPTCMYSARNDINHWPFSKQFQHLADQNPFWSAKFTVHFQWDRNQ